MNRLSLRNNRLKFETLGELPIVLKRNLQNIPQINERIKTGRCQHVTNRLDLESLARILDRLYMPTNFPGTGQWVLVVSSMYYFHVK